MKKHIFILIIIFSFLGCSKDTNNAGGGNTGGGSNGTTSDYYLTALVDGVDYKASGDTNCVLYALNDTVYHLKSFQSDNKAIEIIFSGNIIKGTYDIVRKVPFSKKDLNIQVAYLTDRNDLSKPYYANQNSNIKNGTLTIEEVNSTFIKGSFDVKIDNINITNGKFKCKINGTIVIRDTTTPKYINPCDTPYTHNYGTVSDIDGNTYKTIQIGSQLWMAENLKTTKFNDGTPISKITISSQTTNISSYCWFTIQDKYKDTFGGYYNIYAYNTKKLCPLGWRVPNKSDYETLLQQGVQSLLSKCSSEKNWNENFGGTIYKYGSNKTGFSLIPTGNGRYGFQGGKQSYMFSFNNNTPYIYYFNAYANLTSNSIDTTATFAMENVYSCRCIKE